MTNNQSRCWAVIPAAGAGKRIGGDTPKQYLTLVGKTVLEHSLEKLLDSPDIEGAVVAISDDDTYWQGLNFQHEKQVSIAAGGNERCDSVFNALQLLSESAKDDDWVLVHDAARPCVRQEDIRKLIATCKEQNEGGILAVPVKDTIKKANMYVKDDSEETDLKEISETIDRSLLWHAQTPQMFRLGSLHNALFSALEAGVSVTDEASAMEWIGVHPLLVEGHWDNIKITRQEDIDLALYYLDKLHTEI